MPTSVSVLHVGDHISLEALSVPADGHENAVFTVETVSRMRDGLERFAADEFDCIVTERRLPDGSGIELIETVRNCSPSVPLFLCTTGHSSECVREAVAAGVTEYVPCEPDQDAYPLLATQILDAVTQDPAAERAAKLERITTVIRDLNQALVHASTQSEIDRRVCEILSQSESYLFAWIGEHNLESNTVTGRAAAGVEADYLEQISITTDEEPTAQGPTGKAIRTRELQVMQHVPEDPAYEPWREQALDRGYRSSASVPLVYDGTLYGVLNVYADRVEAFEPNEQELLAELGETIAYALDDVQIREELRRHHRAIEQAADAIFITDVDGTIEYVNPAFETITGYTSAEAIGRKPNILQPDDVDDGYYERLWTTILDGEIWDESIINETKAGRRYHAEQTITPITDGAGEIDGFVAIQRDITERKQRERDLKRSRSRLRVLFDQAPDGIVVHDVDGNVLDVNEALAEMLGYTRAELLSMDVPEFECGIDESTLRERWASMEPGMVHKIEVDGRHRRADGSTYPVEAWISRITTDEPRDRFVAFVRDITYRKHRIRQLQVLDRVLRHNLNNEMAVIRGYAETIEDATHGAVSTYARDIVTACDQLLETARKEREIVQVVSQRPHCTEIDLAETIRETADRLRAHDSSDRIEVRGSDSVRVDATTNVDRAFEELLENALVHNDRSQPEISVELTHTDDGAVSVRIADNGPRIPPEEACILTGEEQVDPLSHGSGLGLWLVYWIVERSDGDIRVESNDPRGNVIEVTFPSIS